jgi:putative transposase
MINYYPSMFPDEYFHVFNRGNNKENLFYKPENATYFLGKCKKYLLPVLEIYAYCLLPNHFHMLVRVKNLDQILSDATCTNLPGFNNLEGLTQCEDEAATAQFISEMVSAQFRLMFMAYAKAINKQENRVGSLFQKNFKRLNVKSDPHLLNLALYIHANPQLHDLCGDFRDWTDSSYEAILSSNQTNLRRTEVMDWFGGREQFVLRHNEYIDWKTAGDSLIED